MVSLVKHLGADDNTLAAGGLLLMHVLVLGGAVGRVIGVSASRTTAVELDAVTSAGDSVAFARAA
jgi:predicted lysophospholipase L1 biosynthesis ABC-type transport system permease subunit